MHAVDLISVPFFREFSATEHAILRLALKICKAEPKFFRPFDSEILPGVSRLRNDWITRASIKRFNLLQHRVCEQMPAADEIEYINTSKLTPYPRNARVHSKKQIRQLVEAIKRFGFTAPLLIDEHNMVLAGHARLEAAQLLGLRTILCRRLLNLSDTLKRAYVVADNKHALNATWDEELLGAEPQSLLATLCRSRNPTR